MQTHKRTSARTIEPQDFLLPDPTQRRRPGPQLSRTTQIEDAVFEVVSSGSRQHHRVNDNPHLAKPSAHFELLPALASIGGRLSAIAERQLAKLSPQAFVTLLSSLAILVFWMCGGFSAIVASASQLPSGQLFALVDTSIDTQDANGMKIALVTGAVRNTSGKIINAPRLAIVAGAHQDIIGTVSLVVDRIGPGMTIPFSGRFRLDGGKFTDIAIIPERP